MNKYAILSTYAMSQTTMYKAKRWPAWKVGERREIIDYIAGIYILQGIKI